MRALATASTALLSGDLRRFLRLSTSTCIAFFLATGVVLAQSEKSKTAYFVKVRAAAKKPDPGGSRQITVTLDIDQGYFLMGSKLPEDFAQLQLSVAFAVGGKMVDAEVAYPPGRTEKDAVVGDYTTYQGKVVITGTLRRTVGDSAAPEIIVRMQGYPVSRGY